MKKLVFKNLEDTRAAANKLVEKITGKKMDRKNAVVVALVGELGSGKTTFAQDFAKAIGVKEKIKSPTFIIFRKSKIQPATSFKYFYHFDAYRIRDEKEILNLGWKEIINNPENIVLVEWADKIKKILPKNSVKINFKHKRKDKRAIIIG